MIWIYIILTLNSLAILYIINKVRKPIRLIRPKIEGEEEGSTAKLGQALERWKPIIIKQLVKKGEKDKEADYLRRKQTITDVYDGIVEFLKADALKDIIRLIKGVTK